MLSNYFFTFICLFFPMGNERGIDYSPLPPSEKISLKDYEDIALYANGIPVIETKRREFIILLHAYTIAHLLQVVYAYFTNRYRRAIVQATLVSRDRVGTA